MLMTLHNDIWGDTSVTLIEEIDSQFLIVRELNMLALYSRLDKEQRMGRILPIRAIQALDNQEMAHS